MQQALEKSRRCRSRNSTKGDAVLISSTARRGSLSRTAISLVAGVEPLLPGARGADQSRLDARYEYARSRLGPRLAVSESNPGVCWSEIKKGFEYAQFPTAKFTFFKHGAVVGALCRRRGRTTNYRHSAWNRRPMDPGALIPAARLHPSPVLNGVRKNVQSQADGTYTLVGLRARNSIRCVWRCRDSRLFQQAGRCYRRQNCTARYRAGRCRRRSRR